jgi:hypothetical protein
MRDMPLAPVTRRSAVWPSGPHSLAAPPPFKVRADYIIDLALGPSPMSGVTKPPHSPRRRLSCTLVAAFPRIRGPTLAWTRPIRDGHERWLY